MYHLDLIMRKVIGQIELPDERSRGIEPLDNESILFFGHGRVRSAYKLKLINNNEDRQNWQIINNTNSNNSRSSEGNRRQA